MYIYQEGKLYIQDGEQLVGVEIYSDKVVKVEGSETTLADEYQTLTSFEVQCKFQILDTPYIFPREEKGEVENNEPIKSTKGTSRKSSSK